MAPSNGGDLRARVDGGICLVARLIPETRVRVGHSESGATRAVVQRILLVSSRKPRGGIARGLRGVANHRRASMGSCSTGAFARASAEGPSQTANRAPVIGSIRHLHSSGACKRGTYRLVAAGKYPAWTRGNAPPRAGGPARVPPEIARSFVIMAHLQPSAAEGERTGVPQAGPEPLTRSPRVSSIKYLLPIVLNRGCAGLDGIRPLKLKCSSRSNVSTLKKPFSIGCA
jgi:hypothetical protein